MKNKRIEVTTLPPVIDLHQLARIQSMHRGFLYQHFVAVGTLLLAGKSGLVALVVERDEDIEVVLSEHRVYAQIKTRSRQLIPSDLSGTVARFEEIRSAHSKGIRSLVPEFWVISNAEPSQSLSDEVHTWPKDVHFRSPSFALGDTPALPPAWRDVAEAIDWCIHQADKVPFGSLSPETLIWKLAGLVLFAATGGSRKEFKVSELPTLLEQLVVQLHRFPNLPAKYRPHEEEPDFSSAARIELVIGFSGAGKTTWAAQGSLHAGEPIAYFDVGDMPTSAVAPSLARELAAILFPGKRDEISQLMLPGKSGLQSLRAIDLSMQRNGLILTAVLDNAHRMGAEELITIIKVMPSVRWVLLAQPWPAKAAIEAAFRIEAKSLRGWSLREIAEEFTTHGCRLTPTQADRVRRLTGGLPLFVQDSARMVHDYYDGDTENFCKQVETLSHSRATGQEIILGQVQERLPETASRVASLLAIPDVPLAIRDTNLFVCGALGLNDNDVSAAIRQLEGWGVVGVLRDSRILMHDSFRPLAQQRQSALGHEVLVKAKKLLVEALMKGRGVPTFHLLCKLLPETGQMEALVDVASSASEYFHEFGMSDEFESILLEAVDSRNLSASDRFWALDTIVFWKIQAKRGDEAEAYLHQQEKLASDFRPGDRQWEAIALKRLLLAGLRGDSAGVQRAFEAASALSREDALFRRILRYNYAACLFRLKQYDAAGSITSKLIREYFELLGLRLEDVAFKNPPEIFPKLKQSDTQQDDLKHLGDSLDLHARIMNRMGRISPLTRIQAFKFYGMANALQSAVKLGMDIVDELVGMGDALGARYFMESAMLPVFSEGRALDYFLQVHSQYAVILAYCGDFNAARQTMSELRPFLRTTPELQGEFQNQQRLIELIASGTVRLPEPRATQAMLTPGPQRKIGRNEACPCGSGKKYKKCCGK